MLKRLGAAMMRSYKEFFATERGEGKSSANSLFANQLETVCLQNALNLVASVH